jgi:hypothetical protein|tara:strand:- start:449 stop:568 length:120 start_codon:yes stop_codon:yes gene_type:complete
MMRFNVKGLSMGDQVMDEKTLLWFLIGWSKLDIEEVKEE